MLKAVLLERGVPGGELLNTEWIDDYPGSSTSSAGELAQLMTAHAVKLRRRHPPGERRGASSSADDGIFEVATTQRHGRTRRPR